jgi:transcriptional regulator with XRE-family HTH domain
MSLGQKIVRMRKQKNLQQKDLADRLGITARQLVRWERDQVRPRPKAIEQLAEFLGVTIGELTAEPGPDSLDRVEDPELRELLSYIPELDPDRLEALKKLLKDVITCHQFSRFNGREVRRAS